MKESEDRGFSVELKARNHIKTLNLSEYSRENVLIEGVLGSVQEIYMVDDQVFTVESANGTIRIDLTTKEVASIHREGG